MIILCLSYKDGLLSNMYRIQFSFTVVFISCKSANKREITVLNDSICIEYIFHIKFKKEINKKERSENHFQGISQKKKRKARLRSFITVFEKSLNKHINSILVACSGSLAGLNYPCFKDNPPFNSI